MKHEFIDDTFTAQMWPVTLEHVEGEFPNGKSEFSIQKHYSSGLVSQTRTVAVKLLGNLL